MKAYFKTFKDGNKILCTTYLKTNLIYDLETNTAGINGARLNSFTEIFYHDWRNSISMGHNPTNHNSTDYNPLFEMRYMVFQLVSSEKQPGFTIAPVMVDVMFEILSLNERELQDRLNLTDLKWLRIP